ncbi:MAG: MCE family protein [Pseudonocardia sp.]|nr:MCE family protein [Pseudonocardia sp.]
MTPFRQRNPIIIGVVSLLAIAGLLFVAYRADSLPVIGAGKEYSAVFSESAGLRAGDEVLIAGVKVGKVTGVKLHNVAVLVTFRAKGADIGDRSSASIQIKTLLGSKFLAIDPAGEHELSADTPIPLERTAAPYDVVEAFNALTNQVDQLDTTALANGLRTIATTFRDTPDAVRTSLDGLSRLSVTIASRNDQIAHLLNNTNKVSGVLAARNGDITAILSDGSKLLEELRAREDAISRLLDGTRRLSEQLRGLVRDNQGQIGPTLRELDRLTDTLQRNQENLVAGIRRLGPFITLFNNTLGNGRWFDSYLDGLLPQPIGAGR